jgi:transcriptional regulator PpsR
MASDGFMVIDDVSTRILEANPRATALLSPDERSIVGRPFPLGLIADGAEQITDAMVESRAAGTSSVTLTVGDHRCRFEVNYLRQDQESRLLIKVTALSEPKGAQEAEANSGLLQAAPDAVVVVDERGILLDCNRTFLEWTQTPNEEQIRGRHADQWIGRTNVDASVLMSNLRQYGAVRLYASVLRCRFGSLMDVEISAVKLPGSTANYALFIRDVARRVTADHPMSQQLPSSIEQITRRVGQVPLRELVRESTDVIEALCIEAALELTRDNRASAAELLGLSRQSLYTKLRRYGIGDNGEDE